MRTNKRGEPLAINGALNRPRTKLGLDLPTWLTVVFVCAVLFLIGFRLLALLSFPILIGSAWLVLRRHPKMLPLWALSWRQKGYYDPRR